MSLTRDFTSFDSRNVAGDRPTRRAFPKSWGADYLGENEVGFRFWAPDLERLRLKISGRNREMLPAGEGWFTLVIEGVEPGAAYQFLMPDGVAIADPASRGQSGGVDALSLVVDATAYQWSMANWKGREQEGAIVEEIGIDTFTAAGTFRAAMGRLEELASRGVSMLHLRPVGESSMSNAGLLSAMLPYAPRHAYGAPTDMKAFVDAAHLRGIAVLLDIVHDRFVPPGALFERYVPSFFVPDGAGEKGSAIDFARPAVREFYIENALYWLEEYNLDGLRLQTAGRSADGIPDADFLQELEDRVRREIPGRHRHLLIPVEIE